MKIIRDEEYDGIMMIPLFVDWGVKRCNVEHCTQQPTTIVAGLADNVIGMCEEHYQAASQQPGGVRFTFVWDNFNAFDGGDVA